MGGGAAGKSANKGGGGECRGEKNLRRKSDN